ncbi:unnamed protein product [Arctogadus glacialis]
MEEEVLKRTPPYDYFFWTLLPLQGGVGEKGGVEDGRWTDQRGPQTQKKNIWTSSDAVSFLQPLYKSRERKSSQHALQGTSGGQRSRGGSQRAPEVIVCCYRRVAESRSPCDSQ